MPPDLIGFLPGLTRLAKVSGAWHVTTSARVLASFLLFATLSGGASGLPADTIRREPMVTDPPGYSDFTFRAWQGRPFRVRIYVPENARPGSRVLFVMHGVERDARRYLADWKRTADRDAIILVAPEFSDRKFPGSAEYNLGGVRDPRSGKERDPETWLFAAIEPLFDDVKRRTGSTAPAYSIYGHSAGGQFVHRFVMLDTAPRLERAVAANAGWYTWPDPEERYPSGTRLSGLSAGLPEAAFGQHLTILLGTGDTGTDGDNFRNDRLTRDQGSNRLERGRAFFSGARHYASQQGHRFGWSLSYAPGVDHGNRKMVPYAADLLRDPGPDLPPDRLLISVARMSGEVRCGQPRAHRLVPRRWQAPDCLEFGDYLVSALASDGLSLRENDGHVEVRARDLACREPGAPPRALNPMSLAIVDADGRNLADSRKLRGHIDTLVADGAQVILLAGSPRAGRVTYARGAVLVHLSGRQAKTRVPADGRFRPGTTFFVALAKEPGTSSVKLSLYPVLMDAGSGAYRSTSAHSGLWKPFADQAHRIVSRSREGLEWRAGQDDLGDYLETRLSLAACPEL